MARPVSEPPVRYDGFHVAVKAPKANVQSSTAPHWAGPFEGLAGRVAPRPLVAPRRHLRTEDA